MTLFKDIYEMNELIRNDNRLQLKTTNNIYKLYFDYLKYGIGMFFRSCYHDLNNYVPFSQTEYAFIANGTDNNFQLNAISQIDYDFYVGYKTTQDSVFTEINSSQYTFNTTSNIMTITLPILAQGTFVYIVPYVIGNFIDSLDEDEIRILIEAMNIPFLKEEQNRNSLLTQMVYGGESKIYSQSSHIDSVHSVVKDQVMEVEQLIKEYSFRASPNKLKDLGGQA